MLTRRAALRGGTATVAAIAVTGAVAGPQDDTALLELVASFHRTYQTSVEAKERFSRARRDIEASLGCPSLADYEAWRAFMTKHGEAALFHKWGGLIGQCGELARAIIETPATTLRGTIEKLRIVHLAIGDGEGSPTADHELMAHQDWDAPWMESVIRDLERLAGRAQS